MKKIILILGFLLISQSFAFADEIIDAKGNITICKVVTVADGFVEYEKEGSLYSFCRQFEQSVFPDYVDVRTKLGKDPVITRYSGTILVKDFGGVRIRTEKGDMNIPWWRVKFVGVYKP